jgi:hypothetical protein
VVERVVWNFVGVGKAVIETEIETVVTRRGKMKGAACGRTCGVRPCL